MIYKITSLRFQRRLFSFALIIPYLYTYCQLLYVYVCALKIELRDYSEVLEYIKEYPIGKNYFRIDLLVIKKLTEQTIPKNIALIFKTFNLFEIKGLGSTAGIDSYYKAIGYAGLLINQTGEKDQYSSLDVSLTILSCHYPMKLIKHLKNERKLSIKKSPEGVYYINKETFNTQIIVTNRLSPEENLSLRYLTDKLQDMELTEWLMDDYKEHQEEEIYRRYLHQVMTAGTKRKGEDDMYICEGLLNFFGTSSEEIIERTKKEADEYYQPKIDRLSSEIEYLKSLLRQNNISFKLNSEGNAD